MEGIKKLPDKQKNLAELESWTEIKKQLNLCLNEVANSYNTYHISQEDYHTDLGITNIPSEVQEVISLIETEIQKDRINIENIKTIMGQVGRLKEHILGSNERIYLVICYINPLERGLKMIISEFDITIPRKAHRRQNRNRKN